MSTEKSSRLNTPRLSEILAEKGDIACDLYHHALYLIAMEERLRNTIPSPLNRYITVAGCNNGILTIHTSSSAWAARLRFKVPEMLKCLNKRPDKPSIQTIRIKIRPARTSAPQTDKRLSISPETARLLRNVADSISDPDLSESLLRLSKHHY